ncbi:MAG: flagellin, partial [Deltaproteobacteria bacterium]|nr:flagellin [Deltaproteobacteria bacterium]
MGVLSLNSNINALAARRRLDEGSAALQRSFERLSSGLRINRASDDAA